MLIKLLNLKIVKKNLNDSENDKEGSSCYHEWLSLWFLVICTHILIIPVNHASPVLSALEFELRQGKVIVWPGFKIWH